MSKAPLLSLLTLALALFLISCSGERTPKYNPAIGPFDEDGNYVEAWADNPPKRSGGWFGKKKPKEAPEVIETEKPTRQVYNTPKTETRPAPKTTSRPKPKTTPKAKAKPKPKPKPVKAQPKSRRHTVKKGDTLYGLSRKYGVSVSAIQKANKLSGSNIRLGASLVIPGK